MRIWGGRGALGVWLGWGGSVGAEGGVHWGRIEVWLGVAWELLGVHWGSV